MTKVGLLSDTHGYWDEKYLQYFEPCDEIWHAGDIGTLEVARKLAAFRPFRAVYGNIDGQDLRQLYPQVLRFTVDGAEVLMKHIGGYPGKYDPSVQGSILVRPPKLFVSGHSHILKVKFDKTLGMLHINPGAAGIYGFHKVRTMVRFVIDSGVFKDLEVIELAGGFTQEADETYLNLVEKISDGQRIYVPSKEEVLTGNIENISQVNNNQAQSNIATSLININTASKEQLMTLPGIGEAKALDIISYRSTNGNFKNTEDIKNISGIKESAYSKIKDLICT